MNISHHCQQQYIRYSETVIRIAGINLHEPERIKSKKIINLPTNLQTVVTINELTKYKSIICMFVFSLSFGGLHDENLSTLVHFNRFYFKITY